MSVGEGVGKAEKIEVKMRRFDEKIWLIIDLYLVHSESC